MDFSSQDALDAAQRIVRTPRMLVGASAPPAPSPPPAPRPAATVRTLGPDDPPPFDRTRPSVLSVLGRLLAVIVVLALLALAFRA
jgi:hypothetical protein